MKRSPVQCITSVLDYLEKHERCADLSNKRNEKHHFQECWCLVFRAFYGSFALPHFRPAPAEVVLMPVCDAPKPLWFTEKYARPMRRVVEVIRKRNESYDVLACGHIIASHFDRQSKFRRCRECKGGKATAYGAAVKLDKALGTLAKAVKSAVQTRPRRKASC